MATGFFDLEITSIAPQGENGLALTFEVPEALKDVFAFTPGQYLTLRAEIDGEDIRRSYSICSPLSADHLQVGIKCLEDGKFSNFAKKLNPGDTLSVMPPQGRFVAPIEGSHNYLLIAAGSGVTPILSIAQSVLEGEPDSQITLVYGNRTTASIMFREELEALKDRFVDRCSLVHILSREDQDVDLSNGRIDAEKLQDLTAKNLIAPADYDGIYLCGPQELIETCASTLQVHGGAKNAIHFELFTPADGGTVDPKKRREQIEKAAGEVEVAVILDGTRRSFSMDGKADTVLSAANQAGIDLPFSCAGGMCCTCRCQIAKGDAAMDVNFSLEQWEIDAGFVLACQARPTSEKLVLDFDAS